MKRFLQLFALIYIFGGGVFAQETHDMSKMNMEMPKDRPMELLPSRGFVHHPVSTKNKEAQAYFDQGLTLLYAFNDGDAARSFQKAAELDPNLAIAFWGVALAKFPRGSGGGDPENEVKYKESREVFKKALALNAPPQEEAYIKAFSKEFSDAEKRNMDALNLAYEDAMSDLYKRFPKDSDVATLYAISIMNLNVYGGNWTTDGKPEKNTLKMVEVLENGLRRDPKHLGLNHIYIHAIEDSLEPQRALKSADFIRSLKLNSPALGHLVHMPAHIYVRTGNFEKANEANMETAQMPTATLSDDFRKWHYGHVYNFLTYSYSMQGNYAKTREVVERNFDLRNTNPNSEQIIFRGYDARNLVRFRRWDDILKLPAPNPKSAPPNRGVWIWARAQAFAATGKLAQAEAERELYRAAKKQWLEDLAKQAPPEILAAFSKVLSVDESKLEAALALAKADKKSAAEYLRKAVAAQDQIPYIEPPFIQAPSRESLGGVLLQMNDYAQAEQVFREDLKHNPGNGRSLFGLMKSLEGENKTSEAKKIEKQFQAAWKYSDTTLKIEDL